MTEPRPCPSDQIRLRLHTLRKDDAGFITTQFVVAVAFSLVFVTMLANLIVFQYGRGVIRAALDEGVRNGSRVSAGREECLERATAALHDLLGGAMGRGVTLACTDTGDRVEASAIATFRGWLPIVPDWTFTSAATALKEHAP